MEQQAIRNRWDIPEVAKTAIINRQVDIACSDKVRPRESTAAARCLLMMESQNIAAPVIDCRFNEEAQELTRAEEELFYKMAQLPHEELGRVFEAAKNHLEHPNTVRVEFVNDFFDKPKIENIGVDPAA